MQLNDPDLLRHQAYIDGKWCDAPDGSATEIFNPANDQSLGFVPNLGADETRRTIEAAQAAQPAWRALTAKERAARLRKWYELMLANQEDLARIMTAEQGKPLTEARGEVLYAASFIEWFAEEAKRVYGDTIPGHQPDKRLIVTQTPFSALALAVLAERAGIPAGLFSVLPADAERSREVGAELCANPIVRKLSFTGSTGVGIKLMEQCAPTLKKLSLELGGNAPFIVFEDADLDAAVEGALVAKYRNAGQTCVCANRLYVHDAVYEAFAEKLAAAVAKLRVGPGDEAGVVIGPLIDGNAVAKVQAHLADALEKGAKVLQGGKAHELGGHFFEPTVITDVTPDMRVAREETFGPLAPLFRFSDEAEVVRQANDTEFGLAGYFYTRDLGRTFRVAEALEYGMVGINTGLISNEVAPFGGMKASGLGREGSKYGLDEYLEIKYLCLGGI
ncbi:succinate-semialdehyde dehydrogenase [Pseudomonas sp. 1-7]|nr:succinate-semialdehyde dehydrogenase [Pseudomonas sp. 1-7]